MTGQCYNCCMGDHDECYSVTCTCCGDRNREHQMKVDVLEQMLRESLQKGNLGIYDA
jgi:hypothetical protein